MCGILAARPGTLRLPQDYNPPELDGGIPDGPTHKDRGPVWDASQPITIISCGQVTGLGVPME